MGKFEDPKEKLEVRERAFGCWKPVERGKRPKRAAGKLYNWCANMV